MRKVIVLEHISLDGVIQAPGGPDEDTSGGFAHGGWIAPYSDAILGTALRRQMNKPFDLLLGRKTFDIWAPYWPQHADIWPGVNTATKYVASNTTTSGEWQPSVFLSGDIAEKVAEIKRQPGADLHVWGSGNLIQTLIRHDLIDAFWLMIYPITFGVGKRLFADGTILMAFKVTESQATPEWRHYRRVLQNKRNNRLIKAREDFFAQGCAKFKGAKVKFGNEPLRIASNLTRYLINRRVATWDAHTNINGASRI